jgi:hypothetical protein
MTSRKLAQGTGAILPIIPSVFLNIYIMFTERYTQAGELSSKRPSSHLGALDAYHIALCTPFAGLRAAVYSENGSLAQATAPLPASL